VTDPKPQSYLADHDAHRAADAARPGEPSPGVARAQRRRNMAIAFGLAAFAVLLFVVTLAQLTGQTLHITM
jgi:hypothetical protein